MKIVRLKDLEWVPAGHESSQQEAVWKKVMLQKGDVMEGHLQMINWCALRAGMGFSPHYHEDMEEIFIMLRGQAEIRIEDQAGEIGAEEAVAIPPGRVHEMKNVGQEEVQYIVIGISQGRGGKTVLASKGGPS
jgi:mannose-6-phosphate isomerase-like protein (cupin superfamily)